MFFNLYLKPKTLIIAFKYFRYVDHFDVCIIDDAAQCSEPWSLIPLRFDIQSLILVGDKCQSTLEPYTKVMEVR